MPNMTSLARQASVRELASRIEADIQSLPIQNTPGVRAIRRRYTRLLKNADATFVYDLAWELMQSYGQRWVAYELIQDHKAAFHRLGEAELEELGQGIDSWWTVDSFARTLSGPAWLAGQVDDDLFRRWAGLPDRWWRRAALVSTIALNVRSHGGTGDVPRTLAVCRLLVADHDEMVVKAMSWALRELAPHNPAAVENFIGEHDRVIAALIKREVRNKLSTGLKNPAKGHA
jgi:3-methyladenine DNA glycosylase AlkD